MAACPASLTQLGLSPSSAGSRQKGERGKAATGREPTLQTMKTVESARAHTRLPGAPGATPVNPDSTAQSPERKPGSQASRRSWHGAQSTCSRSCRWIPKTRATLASGQSVPSGKLSLNQGVRQRERRKEGRERGRCPDAEEEGGEGPTRWSHALPPRRLQLYLPACQLLGSPSPLPPGPPGSPS